MAFNEPPWHPMNNSRDIKTVGKFLEELGEGVAAVARSLIQGIDGLDPRSGKPNKESVEDELADIIANLSLVEERFNLTISTDRIKKKLNQLRQWHEGA